MNNSATETKHCLVRMDCADLLRALPDESVQLLIADPPYNLGVAGWDHFEGGYLEWAKPWLGEVARVLKPSGNFVLFGSPKQGHNFANRKHYLSGDLLDLLYYLKKHDVITMINFIVWYYKDGHSGSSFFAMRHENIAWYAKTKDYYFDLDSVRIPINFQASSAYIEQKLGLPETAMKGKAPTNVWEIPNIRSNNKERVVYPTQKPRALIKRIVRAFSPRGSVVVDCFAGSGVTARVCVEESRHSVSGDISPDLPIYFEKHMKKYEDKNQISLFPHLNPYRIFHELRSDHPVFIGEK